MYVLINSCKIKYKWYIVIMDIHLLNIILYYQLKLKCIYEKTLLNLGK